MMIEPMQAEAKDVPNLALAIIGSSTAPLVLLDGELRVIAASTSFCRSFAVDQARIKGRRFLDVGAGEWNEPQLASLLKAVRDGEATIDAFEMDLVRADRRPLRVALDARRLAYGNARAIRLLISVFDVTEARIGDRLRDMMLQEKAVLMQEMQHRVANSLQLIASVLLQNARNVQSDETRLHLHDAHQRVMSVASLQRHLATSRQGEVALRGYFTELCDSIGVSMIRDASQISLDVDVDDSVIDAGVSVSLGLIVTELVINALKHAFPDHRRGRITVWYRSAGPGWQLSVGDDGVGVPSKHAAGRLGLGTSIVLALAKQLRAEVDWGDVERGTVVSIIHPHGSRLPCGNRQRQFANPAVPAGAG